MEIGGEVIPPAPQQQFVYTVDSNDVVVSVNADFMAFARSNLAPNVSQDQFVGKPLWTFIADRATRNLLRYLLQKTRSAKQIIEAPFRCDSAAIRRFLRFRLIPRENGAVEVRSWIVCEEHRAPVSLFDSSTPRTDSALTVCSWCKKISVSNEWMEVERAIAALDLFGALAVPQLTHGVCPTCAASLDSTFLDPGGDK